MYNNPFSIAFDVVKKVDKLRRISDSLKDLERKAVYVGIPADDTARKEPGEELNNAQLGYIHDQGSPRHGIPKREFMRPPIEANRDALAKIQKSAVTSALDGNSEGITTSNKRLGIFAVSCIKKWFTDPRNGWAPNAPATVRRKLRRISKTKKGRAKIAEMGADASRPLIDTGQLINSIHSVTKD